MRLHRTPAGGVTCSQLSVKIVSGHSALRTCWAARFPPTLALRVARQKETMTGQEAVDYELEVWARTLLIGSRRPSAAELVKAYRILAQVNPNAYELQLARALVNLSWDQGRQNAQQRLPLLEEAVATARTVFGREPTRTKPLIDALDPYQVTLYELGRRAEGLAVRMEMAEVSHAADNPVEKRSGLQPLAYGLAEEGRYDEAAVMLKEIVEIEIPEYFCMTTWDQFSLVATLEAAGQVGAAVHALNRVLNNARSQLAIHKTSLSDVFHMLVWYAVLADRAEQTGDAVSARTEAADLLGRLAESGEPRGRSGEQFTTAGILITAQASDVEPIVPGQPRPAFGVDMSDWSRDLRIRYVEQIGANLCECGPVSADTMAHAAQRELRLPQLATLRRRIAIRTAAYGLWHLGHSFLTATLPAFDDSVAAASQWRVEDGASADRALIKALTDRSMVLVAGHRYGDALADYQQAMTYIERSGAALN